MAPPLLSTFSLVTELIVTASVFYIIYRAYHEGVFLRGFAYGVLAYELLFNISYMSARVLQHVPQHARTEHGPFEVGLAIFHGTFSLLMFALLIAFFLFAARGYARGDNFFKTNAILTIAFVVAWTISVFSGIFLFFLLYAPH